ncbi:hypothetical protein pb186bvf_017737 [Paramecium bursaria]
MNFHLINNLCKSDMHQQYIQILLVILNNFCDHLSNSQLDLQLIQSFYIMKSFYFSLASL